MSRSSEQITPDISTIDWLLEPENPSVRYHALLGLARRSATDSEVENAREAVQHSQLVTEILKHQLPDGSWRGARGDLWEEKGTVFSLLLLGEMGVEAGEATGKALDFLYEHYQLPTGRITYRPADSPRHRQNTSTWMWCVTAVTLRAALLLGHADHPLVESAVSFFEESHEGKGGWHCGAYSSDPAKVRPPNCYMGGIKALSAFSMIPQNKRSKKLRAIINQEVETCLDNHVCFYRVDPKGEPAIKRSWLKFAFPRYWRSDALEATSVLTSLGVQDERMRDALNLIRDKQQSDGRWLLDFSETKRAWVQLDEEGIPSKWVTLRALSILHNSKNTTVRSSASRDEPRL